jgi:iron(III) transport system ATP-binding protein/putative spermidine/putrescine transport system ATP-binding protein
MRGEIRDLQQRLKITTVYVTHDQEEALAVSDRIAVMQAGRIEQLGGPVDIYRKPANLFVAQFMGTTNVLTGIAGVRQGETVNVRVGSVDLIVAGLDASEGEAVSLCLRPEALRIVRPGEDSFARSARIEATIRKAESSSARSCDLRPDFRTECSSGLQCSMTRERGASPGERIVLAYDPACVTSFRQDKP